MMPTNIFPRLGRKYPGCSILAVKEAYRAKYGWSTAVYSALPTIVQLRYLKEDGFTQFKLLISSKRAESKIILCNADDLICSCKQRNQRNILASLFSFL